ncbi:flagellar protein FlaG [Paenibacillus sedimenti]|uniref:Flagellar protein FlaG n=1 Tax=Paenibacillus sedimenti TaxID=2770274 RepID=A0A926QMQ1_9BACL|nr:flagellar protein FlaG [Paenibacillus sedimenti]MBD0384163.1 flagellar protein FlaG [Paenibacillus sedimenti]
MSSDMSIGGEVIRSLGAERTVPESKVKTTYSQTETVSSIHSVKEMRQAELQGDQITISDEQLIRAVERAIKAMEGTSTSLEFSIHDQTKKIMVKVKDRESGEVIRELPPEKSLDFLAKVWEMAGLLVDEKR